MSAVYPKAKEQFGQAGINLLTDDIRVMLVLSTYTYNAAHQFLSDLGAVDNGRSAALGTKDITNGIFDAADSSITAPAGSPCNALIIYKHTGADATARLITYLDAASILGLPFTPEAGQICPAVWDNGANKIFAL